MITTRYADRDFEALLKTLTTRRAFPDAIEDSVREILDAVRARGDAAISEYAMKFDGARLAPERFRVHEREIAGATTRISKDRQAAIRLAIRDVTAFAESGLPKNWTLTPRPGVTLGKRFHPLDRIAAYIPGGAAPLVSTIIHTVAIAKTAGVREIVMLTPPGPKDGSILPEMLFAAHEAGATEVYRLGGVYGVAAMAYGTETIRRVQKLVGPGNAYVTAAKKLVYGETSLDMVAGPSEIMVIADDTANPAFIAADMLSQAEHGSGLEQAVLVTNAMPLIEAVKNELEARARKLSRRDIVDRALRHGAYFIEARDLDHAAEIASAYGPEHLEVMCRDAEAVAEKVTAAGAIFIGPYSPEPVGDFTAGPSHVLPTGGSARFFSGLTVDAFFRSSSVIQYGKEALRRELPAIQAFAAMEGLDAHGASAAVRFEGS